MENNSAPQHQQGFAKPKLAMMLPDPTRYSPPSFVTSQPCTVDQTVQEPKLSLPSIRELLSTTEPRQPQQSQQQSFHLQPPQPPQQQQQQQHHSQHQQHRPSFPQGHSHPPLPHQYPPPDLARTHSYQPMSPQQPFPPRQQHQQPLFQQYPHPSGRTSPLAGLPTPNMAPEYRHQQIPLQQQLMIPSQHSSHQTVRALQHDQRPTSNSSSSSLPSSSTPPSPSSIDDLKEGSKRKKRQNLPRQTTLILLNWLSEHLDRPYPNSREKYELLMKTRLTIQQLDNWFINARRRKINILKNLKENEQPLTLSF